MTPCLFIVGNANLWHLFNLFSQLFKNLRTWELQVWLYNIGLGSLVYSVEKICDESGEDPNCSRLVYLFCHNATENVYFMKILPLHGCE